MSRISQFFLMVLTLNFLFVAAALAQNCGCQSCKKQPKEGDNIKCVKVCKLRCIEKPVEFTCWKSEFEDICLPSRSKKCGEECVSACNCEDGADGCGKKHIYSVWHPEEAELKTRRKLYRKTVTKMIPTYEWEIESRCHECCQGCAVDPSSIQLPAGVPQPPEGFTTIDLSGVDIETQVTRLESEEKPTVENENEAPGQLRGSAMALVKKFSGAFRRHSSEHTTEPKPSVADPKPTSDLTPSSISQVHYQEDGAPPIVVGSIGSR